tara:strand:- start:381 stop:569 length:189 start_codon:yes stop_codon:yes gene_type:complete
LSLSLSQKQLDKTIAYIFSVLQTSRLFFHVAFYRHAQFAKSPFACVFELLPVSKGTVMFYNF